MNSATPPVAGDGRGAGERVVVRALLVLVGTGSPSAGAHLGGGRAGELRQACILGCSNPERCWPRAPNEELVLILPTSLLVPASAALRYIQVSICYKTYL